MSRTEVWRLGLSRPGDGAVPGNVTRQTATPSDRGSLSTNAGAWHVRVEPFRGRQAGCFSTTRCALPGTLRTVEIVARASLSSGSRAAALSGVAGHHRAAGLLPGVDAALDV